MTNFSFHFGFTTKHVNYINSKRIYYHLYAYTITLLLESSMEIEIFFSLSFATSNKTISPPHRTLVSHQTILWNIIRNTENTLYHIASEFYINKRFFIPSSPSVPSIICTNILQRITFFFIYSLFYIYLNRQFLLFVCSELYIIKYISYSLRSMLHRPRSLDKCPFHLYS